MSDTKKNWLDKTGVIHLWNTIKALLDTKVDKIEGLGLSSNDYTVEDKTKVSKIKPVQNTLTSTDTEAGLSAAQGKVLKDIVDTKADNINVQPITIPTTGWGTENGVSAYPNYIDIPLAGVSSKDAVVIDISPSSAYFAAQAQFTNTESMDGAVRIRAKNVPTAAIKGQWYVIHGGGTVYEGDLHNYYDKSKVDELLKKKLDLTGGTLSSTLGVSTTKDEVIDSNKNIAGDSLIRIVNSLTNSRVGFGIGDGGGTVGIFDLSKNVWLISARTGEEGFYLYNQKCLGFVVASGAGYVRFGDGTQICWGDTPAYPVIPPRTTYYVRVNFAAPFNNMAYSITADPVYDGGNTWVLHTFSLGRATSYATIGLANGSTTDTVNAGTIYSYIAIGTWK